MIMAICELAFTGFVCLLLYRLSEYVRTMPFAGSRSVPKRTDTDFHKELAEQTTKPCPDCGTPVVGSHDCVNCGRKAQGSGIRMARKSFSGLKKGIENQEIGA